MANSTSITNWLNQPAAIGKKDRKSIAELTAKYPYFVPIRYINAAQQHLSEPFTPAMLSQMLLYKSNWLLFHEFLEKVATAPTRHVEQEDSADTEATAELIDIDTFEAAPEEDDDIEEIFITDNHKGSAMHHIVSNIDETTEDTITAEEWPTTNGNTVGIIEPEEEKVPTFNEMKAEVDGMNDVPETVDAEPISNITVTTDMTETDVNAIIPVEQQERISFSSMSDFINENGITPPATQSLSSIWEEEDEAEIPETVEEPETVVEYITEEPEALTVVEDSVPDDKADETSLIQPFFTEDYFRHEGITISNDLDKGIEETLGSRVEKPKDPQSLMVVMSFGEWLNYFKTKGQKDKEEIQDQKALKTMWQKEKLAAALEEENEEIPENVFNMAVNSITKEDDLASESLAEILVKQGKYDKAIDMYRKLSLRNPQKSTYFALKIESLIKG